MAYGLVVNLPRADQPGQTGIPAIETATLFIVVVTTLVLGSATGALHAVLCCVVLHPSILCCAVLCCAVL